MATKFFGIAAIVVGGFILADILIHPQGTQALGNAGAQFATPVIGGLLGAPPPGYKVA